MKTNEKGVSSESEVFFLTPSETARELLYYITRCGHYFCNTQYMFNGSTSFGRHPSRQTMLMMYVQSGSMSLTLNGVSMQAVQNQVILVDCLLPHEYRAQENTEFYWMHIDGVNSRTFCEHILAEHGNVFNIVQTAAFHHKFQELINSCQPTTGTGEVPRSQMVYQLLCTAYHSTAQPGSSSDARAAGGSTPIDRALCYMSEHLSEDLNVTDIAACAGMSSSHFSRQFREATTYSPHEYLVLKRIDYAQWLLYATVMPIREIAEKTGYNSETNFIVSFKKKMGISPSRFRKLTKPNQPQNV
ncbi:AraC family transcriptional regulator [Ruminococcus sp. OA3]|uniref:AraC family transcriptional regulator n=1 Tax=Ruminococcus sp. OA3 TaxID=2914164 RepID=UPI001F070505|nr:AraC family transcriptional regulator [Ruminococcus sp. OA3]MCH1982276.1 AraC family transcriptional regulator [Ruminococcus sp. OA3]